VVLGGTSLFGGRGSVLGTLIGALIVAVLRSGLTQAGIDSLYQDVATGILVIVAVAVDRFSRGRIRDA
jgi:fructose transport system permease protein